jgi:putative transposase
VEQNYQRIDAAATGLGSGESVAVVIGEVIADVREGLLAMAVGTGLQVMAAMMAEDVSAVCGPKGKHDPDRTATRHGSEQGSVTLGGRRVPITRPRMRASDGSGELSVPSYELFSGTEVLGRMAMEKMVAGVSTRRYRAGLEPVGVEVAQQATATSRSAVSRRFIAATETALGRLMTRRLDELDLVAFFVDGVHFGEHTCVVALGVDIDGVKHPLAIEEGSTENATLVTGLICGLRDRGLDVTKPILAIIDGSKALARAIRDVFDKPLIQRCQQHKIENVKNGYPTGSRAWSRSGSGPPTTPNPRSPPRPRWSPSPANSTRPTPAPPRAARGPARNTDHPPPRRAAYPGPHAAHDQPDRVDDRDLP